MQLPENATLEQAATLAASLPAAVASGTGPLRIDARGLKAYDSSTLALLMQAHRLAQAAGREVEVVGLPVELIELARLYGIEELLSLESGSRSAAA